MSATPDVITVASTPTPADTQAPPDGFAEFQAYRRAQDRGDEPPLIETPKTEAQTETTLPETPAETPKGEPVKTEKPPADKPEVKTATEPGTGEEEEQVREETEEAASETPDKSGKVQPDKVQKRIDRLTREKYELKGRIAALEEQLKVGKPAEPETKPETKPAAAAPEGKPKVEDFENYEEFTEALADWKFDQREKTRAAETAKTEAKTAYETKKQAWDGKVAELKAKPEFEDYDDRMADTRNVRLSPEIDYAIFEAGPEVAYHLASNLPELERIAKLAPMTAALEIGAIKASLLKTAPNTTTKTEAAAPAPKPKVTSAPKPIVPVGGGTGASTPSVEDERLATDFTAWKKVRRAQDKDR